MKKIISLISLLLVVCMLPIGMAGCEKDVQVASGTASASANVDANGSEVDTTASPEPTANLPLTGVVVCINAGHQIQGNKEKESCAPWDASKNPTYNIDTLKAKCTSGATGKFTGIPEYITTLQISKCIETTLKELGATVVMVRDVHEVDISNIERAKIANDAKADVLLNIHCNGSENETVNGVELYVRGTGDGSSEYAIRAGKDYQMATELLTCITEATGAKKRSVNKSDAYSTINWAEVPSIILELGFISNETEDNNLNDAEYQKKIADGIATWLKATAYIQK